MQTDHPRMLNRQSRLLGWFVLLSVLAHAVFLAIPTKKSEQTLYVNLSSPLQVTVISTRSATSAAEVAEVDTKPTTPQHKTDNRSIVAKTEKTPDITRENSSRRKPDNRRQVDKNSTRPNSNRISSTDTAIETSTNSAAPVNVQNVPLNHLRQQLKEMIRTRFTYPRMARRMGWEGLVGLSLHIEDDGSLNQVRVARSSGHKVLDDNARKTIQSIGRIQVAANLTIEAADTEIEVLYRLTD